MPQLYSNNASARLVEDLQPGDTVINLAPGEGDRFPLPDAGVSTSYALMTLEDSSGYFEIVKLQGRSGDILTIERAQENTAASGFAIGSRCECRMTAGSLNNFVQQEEKGDLRLSDPIDVDGIRYWHTTDPSRYQYFEYKYHTNVFGMQVMVAASPPSLPGNSWGASIVGPGGATRYLWLTEQLTSNALRPVTDEVCVSVPGVLSIEPIEGGGWEGNRLYISNANSLNSAPGPGDWCRFHTARSDRRMEYTFTTRDADEQENYIAFLDGGQVTCSSFFGIRNKFIDKYPDSDQVLFEYLPNPFYPAAADVVFMHRNKKTVRALDYSFITAETNDEESPPTLVEKQVLITKGKVKANDPPTEANDLCNKAYVDGAAAMFMTAAEATPLFSIPTPANSGVLTLANGATFESVGTIELLVHSDNDGGGYHALTLVVADMITSLGYGNRFVVHADDKRTCYWTAVSSTEFSLTTVEGGGGHPTYTIHRIIGRASQAAAQNLPSSSSVWPVATNRIPVLE